MQKFPLPGSECEIIANSKQIAPADPAEKFNVSVILRPTDGAAIQERLARIAKGDASQAPLSRQAFAQRHGASDSDIEAGKTFCGSASPGRSQKRSGTANRDPLR